MSDAGELAAKLGLKPPAGGGLAARLGLKPPAELKDISSAPREEQAAGPGGFSADTSVPGWMQSLLGGVTHGLGNVVHGGARIGARMGEAQESAFGPELPAGSVQRVDETARKREEAYQVSPERKAHPYVAGAGEMVGEGAGLAAEMGPMAAASPAATLPRWMMNLGIGAVGALATPRGGESMGPTAQLGRAATGLVGGAVGAAVGEAAGSQLAKAIAGADLGAIDRLTTGKFRSIMKPPRGQRSSETQLKTQDQQILSAFDDLIRDNKQAGQPPPLSIRDFSEGLDRTKRNVFQEYDQKARSATEEQMGQPNPHLVGAFQRTGTAAQQAQNTVREANQRATMTAAATSRAGNNVYSNAIAMPAQQQAQRQVAQAQAQAARAAQAHDAVKTRLYQPYVDLAPVATRLRSMSHESRFADLAPAQASAANDLAYRLERKGFYGLMEAQDTIQSLNSELNAFYRNPTPAATSKAVLDAEMAGMLRESLDKTIEGLTSPGYQALKNRYGALRAVEKDVVGAYQREMNKIPGGIGGIFADLVSTAHGIKAVGTLDPHALGVAVSSKAAKWVMSKLRDPNRAIAKLYNQRAATFGQIPVTPEQRRAAQAIRGGLPRTGAILGREQANQQTTGTRKPAMSYEIAPRQPAGSP